MLREEPFGIFSLLGVWRRIKFCCNLMEMILNMVKDLIRIFHDAWKRSFRLLEFSKHLHCPDGLTQVRDRFSDHLVLFVLLPLLKIPLHGLDVEWKSWFGDLSWKFLEEGWKSVLDSDWFVVHVLSW